MSDITQRQLPGSWCYGRYYGPERPRKYLFPIDEAAQEAMDIFHKFFQVLREGELYRSPLQPGPNQPLRILDLGTGTGIWAIEVADAATKAGTPLEIMAVDINMIQPPLIPPSLVTLQLDIEKDAWGPLIFKNCDLVYMRMLYGSIRPNRWPHIYRKIFLHLKPGTGYIEHVEMDWVPRWDGPSPERSALLAWSRPFLNALRLLNKSAGINGRTVQDTLYNAGFIDIRSETVRCYLNPGTSGAGPARREKWFNAALSHFLYAMSLLPMIEGLGYSPERVKDICDKFEQEMVQTRFHAYFTLHIWYARRPS